MTDNLATVDTAEEIARAFHEAYERLAPDCEYETRMESRVDWDDVPANNRRLMIKVAAELLERGVIVVGPVGMTRG